MSAFATTVLIAVAAKTVAWLLQYRLRNAGLVDAIWAWTLGLLAVVYAAVGPAPVELRLLLAVVGGAWGLRLGTHLFFRNWAKPEDWRYAEFRRRWGAQANRNMFWFFQFQNLFTLILSALAFIPVAWSPVRPPLPLLSLAVLIAIAALVGEALADRQMERFRADPRNAGAVCRDGLWRYSRHPNYFFECLYWLAYLPLAFGSPWAWVTLGAPLVMAWLLLRLSGVPLLEAEMARRKPGYAEYQRTTSLLIPLPPRPSTQTHIESSQ